MTVDYHVHTRLCGHARGTLEELVEAAVGRGLREIGIADHLPLPYSDDRSLSMDPSDLPRYVEQVLGLKDRYSGRIEVRLGIEADYHPPALEKVEHLLASYPFDYVIGSIHYLRGWIFDDPTSRHRYDEIDVDEFYREYLEALRDMVDTRIFDIVGHADLVKKFGARPTFDLEGAYRGLLAGIKEAGMCFEVNTAGLRWPAGEVYPEPAFIRLGGELGVPVTLGSDSHCPEDVGRDFDLAVALLKEAGYSRIALFREREMRLEPL